MSLFTKLERKITIIGTYRKALIIVVCLLLSGCSQQSLTALRPTTTPKTETLIVALEDPEPEVRAQAARELGEKGDVLAIEPLIELLGDISPDVQQSAIDALVKFGNLAIDPLIATLENGDYITRPNAATALSQINDDRIVELLLKDLISTDNDVQKSAVVALGNRKLSDSDAQLMILALSDNDPYVREAAAEGLGLIKETRAVVPLITMLTSYETDMIASEIATVSLIQIGAPSVEPLIALLSNDDPWIQYTAEDALSRIGDPAVEQLIAALKDSNPQVRKFAAEALGEIKDARAVEPLLVTLRDEDENVRNGSRGALSSIGAPAVEPFIALLKDEDPEIRRAAVLGLSGIKDDRTIEPIIAALQDENDVVRSTAAEALGKKNDARAVEPLIIALTDAETRVRWAAVNSLGELKDARSVESLIMALKDEDSTVRDAAAQALLDVGTPAVEPLLEALENQDLRIIASAYQFYIHRGEKGSEEVLIKALNEYGFQQMANAFLNCGNSLLEDAATVWANEHHYIIYSQSEALDWRGPVWGDGK